MEAESVMATVRSGAAPSEWNVWPLRRDRVLIGAAKWGSISVIGFTLFVLVLWATFPSDFIHADAAIQSAATVIILLVGALAFCSLWLTVEALLRVRRADDYWLVITPTLFIKAGPRRLFQIPLEDIADITLKGVAQLDDATSRTAGAPRIAVGPYERVAERMGVVAAMSRRTRVTPSLAFRDQRDNRAVTIGTDDSFDHLGAIEQILRERVSQRETTLWRTSHTTQRA